MRESRRRNEVILMKTLQTVAFVLLVVGGLNWGLVGLFSYDLVSSVLGEGSALTQLVFVLVGVSAVWVGLTQSGKAKK
jgi:uncharacterized protein